MGRLHCFQRQDACHDSKDHSLYCHVAEIDPRKTGLNMKQECLKVDDANDKFRREVVKINVNNFRGKVLKSSKSGNTVTIEDDCRLPKRTYSTSPLDRVYGRYPNRIA